MSTIVIALAKNGHNVPYAYNRKEAKDHGEGGTVVGAPLVGRVLIVDDVISAGTSVRESIDIISAHQAIPCGVSVAIDRQERGLSTLSAVQEVEKNYQIPVISIANVDGLIKSLAANADMARIMQRVVDYKSQFGV